MTRRKDPVTDTTALGQEPAPPVTEPGSDPAPETVVVAAPPPTDPVPTDPTPEPPAAPAPTLVPSAPARRSGVMGPLLGGALAALGGFGLSHFNLLGLAAPDQGAAITALDERLTRTESLTGTLSAADQGPAIAALQQTLDDLALRVRTLEDAPAPEVDLSPLAGLDQRLQAIEALPAGGDASTAALAAKLAELERKLNALPPGGAASAEVEAALARLAEAEAQARARADEAAALAAAAEQAQAIRELTAAAASGASFAAELAAVSDPQLQAALTPHVAGVASLAQLQADFPEAARAVLLLSREISTEDGWGTRLLDFLGSQTGARSLTPREGDDPDAILSRAEFALTEGRLAETLAEISALDPALLAPLDAWRAAAEARVAVDAALATAGGL